MTKIFLNYYKDFINDKSVTKLENELGVKVSIIDWGICVHSDDKTIILKAISIIGQKYIEFVDFVF